MEFYPMKRLLILLLLMLNLFPLTVLAQDDDEPDWAEYTSDNGLITFAYPPEWELVEEMADLNIFILTSNPTLMEEGATSLEPNKGDIILSLILLNETTFAMIKPDAEMPDLTLAPDDLVKAAVNTIINPYYGTNGEILDEADVQIGVPEIVELKEDLEVGVITIIQPDVASLNLAYPIQDALMVVSASVFGVEEIDKETAQTVYDVLAGFQFTGTAEDLTLIPE
jgi:hypothetical protein